MHTQVSNHKPLIWRDMPGFAAVKDHGRSVPQGIAIVRGVMIGLPLSALLWWPLISLADAVL